MCVLVAVLALPVAARADRIDGHWCAVDGRLLTIDGPSIVTPGGNRIPGDYGRHTFIYIIPAGEPGAGGDVQMRQLNDETIHILWPGAADVEVWNRCDVTS